MLREVLHPLLLERRDVGAVELLDRLANAVALAVRDRSHRLDEACERILGEGTVVEELHPERRLPPEAGFLGRAALLVVLVLLVPRALVEERLERRELAVLHRVQR